MEGDGQRLVDIGPELVGDPRGVGLGDRLAFGQRLGRGEAVVEGVGPQPGGVDRDAAVGGARRAVDRPGEGGAGIDVGGGELAAGGDHAGDRGAVILAAGLGHRAGQRGEGVGDDGDVVGAVEGDGQRCRRGRPVAVLDDVGECVRRRRALRQRLRIRVRIVERVAVAAVGVDGHRAVGAGDGTADVARHAVDRRHRLGVTRVDIGVVGEHVADGCRVAGIRGVAKVDPGLDDRVPGIGVGHRHRTIVGAGNGHYDVERRRSVERRHGQRFRGARSLTQSLGVGIAIVERVGPLTRGRVKRERAVRAVQGARRWVLKMVLAKICVIDEQSAARRGVAKVRAVARVDPGLGNRIGTRADHRNRGIVVGAGNINLDGRFAQRAVAETDRIDELVSESLAGRERIDAAALARNARAVGNPVFDLAVVDPHPIVVERFLPERHAGRVHVLSEKIEVCRQRVAIAVFYREQRLGAAANVVCHDVEKNRAGNGVVKRRTRPKDVLEKKVVVVLRLRRVGE